MNKERVLVTGGAGFIGRTLVMRCLEEGHRVTVVDNLCTGRRGNLEPFRSRISFDEADILDEAHLERIMAEAKPEIVFHLAAHHFIPFCNEHPRETLRVNVEGTHLVLSAASRHGANVAVVASSGAFYPSLDEPLNEDLEPAPVDVYGLSKLMAEQVASFVASTTRVRCVAARLFNTYGPYETNPHLIPEIVESLHRGPSVRLGNIHTKRDYIYVEDVADLLYRSALIADRSYTVLNVGAGAEHSAADIVKTIAKLLRREIKIEIEPSRVRAVDKLHQRADTRRLQSLTGGRPRHSLIDGLQRLLEHERLL